MVNTYQFCGSMEELVTYLEKNTKLIKGSLVKKVKDELTKDKKNQGCFPFKRDSFDSLFNWD